MGSTDRERRWFTDDMGGDQEFLDWETPRHRVDIGYQFAVGKYEVTKGEFARFVRETGRDVGGNCYYYDDGWKQEASKNWRSPGFSQSDNEPVVCVNWDDAKAFAQWLSRKTGQKYRLLSESEWEYAARAGTQTMRYWGDDWENEQGCRYGNMSDIVHAKELAFPQDKKNFFMCRDGETYTARVGKYQANAFGLHDMIGNVMEWTEDCWNETYRGVPTNGKADTTGDCSLRVNRGGSWSYIPGSDRAAQRGRGTTSGRSLNLGFRLARTF
ncbi:formylglycine-generating enzyme family protein [Magnetospira thiophila]